MIRITAIRTSPSGSMETSHITHVRWVNPTTELTRDQPRQHVADWIDKGGDAYVQNGSDVSRVVTYPLNGKKFLRTTPDNTTRDNLLSLPRF